MTPASLAASAVEISHESGSWSRGSDNLYSAKRLEVAASFYHNPTYSPGYQIIEGNVRSSKNTTQSNQQLWDAKADEWNIQVGNDGDYNRRFNSDPVLWRYLEPVDGRRVLDAGCGTGYLSRKLARAGAEVIGVDYSSRMIAVAQGLTAEQGVAVEYHVDSCASLQSVAGASVDKLVSNYVLQDLPELAEATRAFYRVLRSGGTAVIVLTHPCFPQSDETEIQTDGAVNYRWRASYFEAQEHQEAPWNHFTSPFLFYHRPLSGYWRAFRNAGFEVADFDEPVVGDPPPADYDAAKLASARMRPNSVAFQLRKP